MKRRVSFRVSILGCALALLWFAVQGSSAGMRVPAGFSDAVIVATNSMLLGRDVSVTGDVATNDASPGPHLDPDFELSLQKDVAVDGSARADSVLLKNGASASGGVECNDGSGVSCSGVALPLFDPLPPFQTADPRADAPDVDVPNGGSVTLAEGDYGDITVGKDATLVFSGGVYQALSLSGDTRATVLFDAATDLRIVGNLFFKKEATVGPSPGSGITAASVMIYVGGANAEDDDEDSDSDSFTGGNRDQGDSDSDSDSDSDGNADLTREPTAAQFEKEAVVAANFYVPNGTLYFKRDATASGGFIARDFLADKNGDFTLDSFFANRPPTADAQDVATPGSLPVDIVLTGSDPEGGTLTFAIATGPTEGTLGPITPIVPPQVGQCSESATSCQVDADCPGTETCILQQPATTSAEVTYTPTGPCPIVDGTEVCPPDSFEFTVADPEGLVSDPAEVGINAPGDTNPPPTEPEDVIAHDGNVETLVDTTINVTLHGSAPCDGECDGVDDVELTFSIVSGPSSGSLGPLTQGSELPQRTADLDYTPNTGFAGTDTFDFEVAGDTNGDGDTDDAGETATATVTVEVQAPAPPEDPVADDVSTTTEMDTEVMIHLSGSPGTEGGGQLMLPSSPFGGRGSGANGELLGSIAQGATRAGPTPIAIGAGWSATTAVPPAFFWSGVTLPVLSDDGPFTFDGEACVSVTDDFQKGDQFRIYDNGVEIGTTSLVAQDIDAPEVGPDAAYADETYSSGTFEVGDGSHSIDIEVIPPNSFNSGRGYIRVDTLDSTFCSDECGLTFTVESAPTSGTVGIIDQTSLTTAELLYTPSEGFVGVDQFTYRVTDCFGNFDIAIVDILVFDPSTCSTCYTLTVQMIGSGAGDVTSNPVGLSCPSPDTCSAEFTQNSPVVLQARPIDLFVFEGWGGDCTGTSPLLTVLLDGDKTCTASFGSGQ